MTERSRCKAKGAIVAAFIAWAAALPGFPRAAAAATCDFPDTRGVAAGACCEPFSNPALLGFADAAKKTLIVPVVPVVNAGYWSDRLALPLYGNMTDPGRLPDYIDIVLDRSFKTAGLAPDQASQRILDGVEGGVAIFARSGATLLALAANHGSLAAYSTFDAAIHLPRDLFAVVFGGDQGVTPGRTLDFKGLGAEAVAISTISASYGHDYENPLLLKFLSGISNGFLEFTDFSWGAGLGYVIGHALLKERTLDGSVKVTGRGGIDAVEIKGTVEMTTAGGGLHGKWKFPQSPGLGGFFPGSGIKCIAGFACRGPHVSLDAALTDLGFIRWGHVRKVVYSVNDTSIRLSRLLSDSLVATKPGPGDTLRDAPALYQSLPAAISLAAGYTFRFGEKSRKVRALSQYALLALRCDQLCAPWPTRRFVPRLSLGIENGALFGFVPLRCGLFVGGAEGSGSSLGCGLSTRYIEIDVGYTAIGTLYFHSKRGMALTAGVRGRW